METKTRNSIHTLVSMYDWHTRLFINVIDGIADKDTQNRLNTKANHIAWIAGSIVHGRFELGKYLGLGLDLKQTSDELFKDYKGIQDNVPYPSLDEYRNDWNKISGVLKDSLASVSEEKLNSPDPMEMPGGHTLFLIH